MGTGAGESSADVSPEEMSDAAALRAVVDMQHDPVVSVMRDVEAAYERDLPVRAADIIQTVALPAAASHIERTRSLELATPVGRTLQEAALTAFTRRRQAMVGYAAALERGLVEDMALVDATRTLRLAEAEVIALHRRLADFPTGPLPATRTP